MIQDNFQFKLHGVKHAINRIFVTIGPPKHHKVVRNLGMERGLLPCYRVTISPFVYAYRYCEGGELFHYIIQNKHLCERDAAKIMKQLFSALRYLHSNSISHR